MIKLLAPNLKLSFDLCKETRKNPPSSRPACSREAHGKFRRGHGHVDVMKSILATGCGATGFTFTVDVDKSWYRKKDYVGSLKYLRLKSQQGQIFKNKNCFLESHDYSPSKMINFWATGGSNLVSERLQLWFGWFSN